MVYIASVLLSGGGGRGRDGDPRKALCIFLYCAMPIKLDLKLLHTCLKCKSLLCVPVLSTVRRITGYRCLARLRHELRTTCNIVDMSRLSGTRFVRRVVAGRVQSLHSNSSEITCECEFVESHRIQDCLLHFRASLLPHRTTPHTPGLDPHYAAEFFIAMFKTCRDCAMKGNKCSTCMLIAALQKKSFVAHI